MADHDGTDVAGALYRCVFRDPGKSYFKDAITVVSLATKDTGMREGMKLD